jgi:cytochrome d ubiquinol oxidase subunit II
VSSTNAASNLTVNNVASGHYSLVVMTVVAALLLPVILLYQGWSFYVFRRRVSATVEASPTAERENRADDGTLPAATA